MIKTDEFWIYERYLRWRVKWMVSRNMIPQTEHIDECFEDAILRFGMLKARHRERSIEARHKASALWEAGL